MVHYTLCADGSAAVFCLVIRHAPIACRQAFGILSGAYCDNKLPSAIVVVPISSCSGPNPPTIGALSEPFG